MEWVNDNAGYVNIMGCEYETDYYTLSNWGILDDVKEEYIANIHDSLMNGNLIDYTVCQSVSDIYAYILMDDGTIIPHHIARDISEVLDMIMTDNGQNSAIFGQWRVSRRDSPTLSNDSDKPIKLE